MNPAPRLLRITTVPISLNLLLRGQLGFFQKQGFDVLAVSSAGKEVDELIKEGIRHEVVPMTRKITPFADLVSLIRLIRVVKRFKPDIVHTHTPKAGLLGMLAAWFARVPVRMHTVAGLPVMEATGLNRRLLMLTERITYSCASKVYPNSTGLANFILKHFDINHKLSIIGKGSSNGIDSSFFKSDAKIRSEAIEIRSRSLCSPGDIVFLFIGRIVADKGIHELAQAFRSLKAQGLSIKLFLVGNFEPDLDPVDDKTLAYLKSDKDVILAGFQADVRPWLAAADIFVFPSYREGFPNVVMQACCMNVPCIVSDINGCNEIITHGSTGLVIPPKNYIALQNAMKDLAVDAEKRRLFSEHARQSIMSSYDQAFVWAELKREYFTMLGKVSL